MEARFSEAFGCVEQHVALFWREKKKKKSALGCYGRGFYSFKKKKNLFLLLILNTFQKIFRKSSLDRILVFGSMLPTEKKCQELVTLAYQQKSWGKQ